ncbi:phage portal protein [Bifidobacterium biavatii]|uniref:Phage portal protein n=1 Tax=Bifidobacterium biavatii DSM 23969 TaxID=1437608 RepID=A0A086ZTV4_9BIFI|nr:phage portal protein [Bifidobacterium biavatii]KFI49954.1 phage portal protein [Bifidobacterium biavatii DSM 23969]
MSLYFESNGRLNDWAASNNIEIVDAGQPLLSYDAETDGHGVKSHPLREVTDFIARMISSLPLKVYRRMPDGGRERVRDGTLAALVANPSGNPAIPPSQFWYALIQDGLLADRYLAIFEQTPANGLRLRRIPVRRWRPLVDDLDEPIGAKVWIDETQPVKLDIRTDGLIMSVGYAFASGKGEPKRRRLRQILDEYDASLEYRAEINKHGIRAPLVITRDKEWSSPQARDRFLSGMKNFTRGGGSGGGGFLLEDGMKAEVVAGFKPIDVDDLNARDKVKIDVANAYGIPPEIIGIREGNFSNLAAFKQMLYGTYLDPYIVQLEQTINLCLRDRLQSYDKGLYLEFDRDAQLRGDPAAQIQSLVSATGRPIYTTNEARELMNKPKIDGGDGIVTPLNVLVGGQTSPNDGQTESRGNATLDDANDTNQEGDTE